MTTRPGYVWDATASEWVEIGQAAVVAPIAYQTSAPSSPATGDIWIDSDDEVPSVDSTLYYRWTKTMSGGQTSLSGTDNNSLALKYTPGYESVFINGVLQVRGSDYVATTGTTVTGLIALTANDVVMVESIVAYSVGDTYTQSTLDGKFSPITTTGLVLLSSTTFSAVASASIDNVFTSAYSNYRVMYIGKGSATATLHFRYRKSAADLTNNYTSNSFYSNQTTSGTGGGGTTQMLITDSNTDTTTLAFDIMKPNAVAASATFTTIMGFSYNKLATFFNGGSRLVDAYTGFSLLPSTGTLTGEIQVYGYK